MISSDRSKKERYKEFFANVVKTYVTLLEGRAYYKVKRAEIGINNEVEAIPTDFLCDVEIKANRILSYPDYEMFIRLCFLGQPELMPEHLQIALGETWKGYSMGPTGDYKALYYRVRNQQRREALDDRAIDEEAVGTNS